MTVNTLYQFSILNALMDGVADEGINVSTTLESGDHGLGTFKHMDGEMIVLDGIAYQMKQDGSILVADPEMVVPFAMVTQFQPTQVSHGSLSGKDGLDLHVAEHLPNARNIFVAIRIDGQFEHITLRTVGKQEYSGERLVDVGKRQVVRTLSNTMGTLVGFYSPGFSQGLSVAGYHLHFLEDNRRNGGHMLDFRGGNMQISLSPITKVELELPQSNGFNSATLSADAENIQLVEG
ncbi:alpha-acetolactate decarboxylase [Lipomyces chichibuensis]|uniref:alpha-acetolactate decarboxylase n=1 Tax=Lipomyces chichibuensis TaxID=1546026 RepID=UPI003343B8AD